jgi:hypothetical protein
VGNRHCRRAAQDRAVNGGVVVGQLTQIVSSGLEAEHRSSGCDRPLELRYDRSTVTLAAHAYGMNQPLPSALAHLTNVHRSLFVTGDERPETILQLLTTALLVTKRFHNAYSRPPSLFSRDRFRFAYLSNAVPS